MSAARDALPACIGERYSVLEQLGRGGTGVVYRVRDRRAAEDVALKQLVARGQRDAHAVEQFEREFQVLAQLQHPSVIEVYDYGIDAGRPFYTMELLDGGDLSAQAPLPVRQACELMIQVCSSLSLLHSRRLVHRDVSPRNVRCTRAGAAKLIDFGAMVAMGPCLHSVGTPAFVAPEVVHHLDLDARTDLFSVGAVLYFALTGKRAFAARTMAELNEAWRVEPAPPGRFAEGVPAALDELVMSLLRIDPALRPRSAFEVMQRLAAVAGVASVESTEVSASYLAAPMLVGRDAAQRRFQQALRRAQEGAGGALLFEGASGIGRSRLLDMCALEGKTAGATVLLLEGSSVRHEAFAGARVLAEQLADALPQTLRFATPPEAFAQLFSDGASAAELVSRECMQADPYATQAALFAWFRAVSRRHLLLLAIDDLDRVDPATLALLVPLVDAADGCKLLMVATLPDKIDDSAEQTLAVLRRHHASFVLEPLDAEQTEAMFASIFFDAPHVALVSHRIHGLAAGRPREAMALVRHLLSTSKIRYSDGNWALPDQMALADLPASAEAAMRLRILRLPPLARRLVEAQALALDAAWTRADYLALELDVVAPDIDRALATLIEQGVLANHGSIYTLSRLGAAHTLIAELSGTEAVERHRALALQCQRRDRPALLQAHHLFHAGDDVAALDRLALILKDVGNATEFADVAGVSRKTMSEIVERAHAAAVFTRRPRREINEWRRVLIELSPTSDTALFTRYGPGWLLQLELDSGLSEYRARRHEPAETRLASAVRAARARFEALPPAERVYGVEEAIKYLARYVSFAQMAAVRTHDTSLLWSLSEKVEPFAGIMPALFAIRETTIANRELTCEGKLERARLRYLDILERLERMSSEDMGYLSSMRVACAYGAALSELVTGHSTVLRWIEYVERSPLTRVNAMRLRRILSILEGDVEEAARQRRQAEIMGAQALSRQLHDPPLVPELHGTIHAGDLAGMKLMVERLGRLFAADAGWLPLLHAAQGYYEYMRGDALAAKREFEAALSLSNPDRTDPPPSLRAWIIAVAGYITVLTELGDYQAACRFGAEAVARAEALEITDGWRHIRALAIAEAKAGRLAAAAQRLDRLIASHSDRNPALLAPDYEARALIAISAHDRAAAARFAELATRHDRPEPTALQLARRGRLLDAAARAGISLDIEVSGLESAVRSTAQTTPVLDAKFILALEGLREPSTRAARALRLLCDAAGAKAGHLYAWQSKVLTRTVSHEATPDGALDQFAFGYLKHQLEQLAMTTVFTATEQLAAQLPIASWRSPQGDVYAVTVLRPAGRDQYFGAVALRAKPDDLRTREFSALVWAVSARLLELESSAASD